MKHRVLIGVLLGVAGGAAAGVILGLSYQRAHTSKLPTRPPRQRFAPFRGRVRIGFEDSSEFIKPSI
jgi:hypothetical protein